MAGNRPYGLFAALMCLHLLVYSQDTDLPLFKPGVPDPAWFEWPRTGVYRDFPAHILHAEAHATVNFVNRTPSVTYQVLYRIKVWDAAEARQGDITLLHPEDVEIVSQVKAYTYNPNEAGGVTVFPVSRRNIHTEKQEGDQFQTQIKFPFVRDGSVIEYSYELRSRRIEKLHTWQFQRTWPVDVSAYVLRAPFFMQYEHIFRGEVSRLNMAEGNYTASGPEQLIPAFSRSRSDQPGFLTQPQVIYGSEKIFSMENIPALPQEDLAPAEQIYAASLSPLLMAYGVNFSQSNNLIFENWAQMNRYLSRKLAPSRRDIPQLTEWLRASKTDGLSASAQIAGLDQYVKRTFRWDSTYRYLPDRLSKVSANRTGASADINHVLLLLLQQAGLEARPVFISTRDNGPIQAYAPVMYQFNHMIVAVRHENTEWLLDATDPLIPTGTLPPNDINQTGYLADGAEGHWITLNSQNRVIRTAYARLVLSDNGVLSGTISVEHERYAAQLEKGRIARADSLASYLQQYILKGQSIRVSDPFVVQPSQEHIPLTVACSILSTDQTQKIGELLIVRPSVTRVLLDLTLEDESRLTPVDLVYPVRDSYLIGLRIPEGYEIAQLPQAVRVTMPDRGATFVFQAVQIDKIIYLSSSVFMERTLYMPEEYVNLKAFLQYVTTKHQEDIVLKKIP
ncbi:MAG: hypothetical protein SF053_16630 [Bacteroidia bacterium]|nr:hypothetical protein [Bacteroidia bacterium]